MMMRKISAAKARVQLATMPWDVGPLTRNQMAGKVVERVMVRNPETGKLENPDRAVRTRRESWIGRYHRRGKLTAAQFNIAVELFDASQGFPVRDVLAALRIDAAMGDCDPEVARVDRRRKFFRMAAAVPQFAAPVIRHVVLHDLSLRSMPHVHDARAEARHLDRLQRGLEALHGVWGRKLLTAPK
ncbi:hypothetical protein [Falsirhodobacter halotolerans]|uniref:hypothetical protein n=1 Tax=Falsirhodobacter halotolerans TaxID=1146892 RepID=UPI001FD17678|nr:hypothetical protein [Falsirhodobacter halotolerans]MCJ8138420.1 hypothetical protein [Falsirhodobacter halotolerans]